MPDVPPGWPDSVRLTALLATTAYAVGVGMLLHSPTSRRARVTWLGAWPVALLHTLIAFGVTHGWSHAAAIAHTERVSGFGLGVYVNELFLAVWLGDAIWRTRSRPPRWWNWAAHGFLAFIMLNATVVFGSNAARILGGVALLAIAGVGVRRLKALQNS